MPTQATSLADLSASLLLPPREMTVSQWADENRVLTGAASAERGQWCTRPYQREPMDVLSPSDPCKTAVLLSAAQMLKCLAVFTPLPTPDGWKPIGEIVCGDTVFDDQGKRCAVVAVSDIFTGRKCYRITFDDGSSVVSDGGHRWVVFDRLCRHVIVTTEQMAESYTTARQGQIAYRYRIPCTKPLDTPPAELPIDPYLLGVWLGDGNTMSAQVTTDLRDGVLAELEGAGVHPIVRSRDKRRDHVATIAFEPVDGRPIYAQFRELGLIGDKHIPAAYLRASEDQRRSLLQGILDTDGTAGAAVVLSITCGPLAVGFVELARSLGFKPTIRTRPSHLNGKKCRDVFVITFKAYREERPFRLKRKLDGLRSEQDRHSRPTEARRRSVTCIEEIESVPVRCIAVDSPTHLYLAGPSMVPTHNTEALLNFLGFIADVDPGPTLVVEPRIEDAKALSKDRVAPMFRATPVLRGKLATVKSRDSDNTTLHKAFTNGSGHVTFAGAISPSGLAMRPIRYVLLDEVDRYPASAGTEGDPVSLAIKRTAEFEYNKKILLCSTPTVKGASRIELAWRESDQREYFVPCPHCGAYQVLELGDGIESGLAWPEDHPEAAQYRCLHCKRLIPEHKKAWMVENGEYRAQNPASHIPGFRVNQLISPKRTWGMIAAEFLVAKLSPETLKVFMNTVLATLWEEKHEIVVDAHALWNRCEPFAAEVPEGVTLLTAGVDVQADRLELEIVGWGRDEESWSVAYHVIPGDILRNEVWAALDEVLLGQFLHEKGAEMRIASACIDSGYKDAVVLRFTRDRYSRRVYATKGRSGENNTIWPRKPSRKNQTPFFMIGVDAAKDAIHSRLKVLDPGPSYCHFPAGRDLEYFEQLTAEKKYTRYHNGFAKHEWKKGAGVRNEALDCRVYAYAALQSLFASGLRLSVHCDRFEKMLGRKPSHAPRPNPEPTQVAAEPEPTAHLDPFRAPDDPDRRKANPFTHGREGGFIPRRNWFGE